MFATRAAPGRTTGRTARLGHFPVTQDKIFNKKCGKPCEKMARQTPASRIKRTGLAICTIVVRQAIP